MLPKFPGDTAVADALAAGEKTTGFTVHVATEKLDDGPLVFQCDDVPVEEGDTVKTLHERIKTRERRWYPQVILVTMASIAHERAEAAWFTPEEE